ncbi:MAG: hypothetical protein KUA35_00590 [Pseudodesulfovibrio sp.]|uniref:DUF4168 domain-containing protein n=1 Tax=Pseudodesulfovibrio aespoeensis (strain ATCC 700646 / DSM 10631 / Aspo-2) TaxID=643562 RepID=E6VQP8_PSEA9|nr:MULTISPECIES: hypothetical protein [Pseudodesulfovibrio]MBU4192093.1 hypothetical protein [Pseudomonadota bacterium]ADU61775.1 hypothetical protein Daes_0758 [Pseudodesulfovibrio aespoeensis Aspo-2]MBU4243048.1 hypothetical protein [Pseudomonadota bacterium]MBU4380174.1 hypothetical protein [Pseudomonadota bacterium]MBU4476693.1 hypothetical protein [Pseudomonadota bacterium]
MQRCPALCPGIALSLLLLLAAGQAQAGTLSEEARLVVEAAGGPFTADEFEKFLADLPTIPELTALGAENTEAGGNAILPEEVLDTIRDMGWTEERFFYIYSHAVTVLSLDQMNQAMEQMRAQMAALPEAERQAMEQAMDTMSEALGGSMSAQVQALKDEIDSEVPASEQALILNNVDQLRTALGIPDEL